MGDLVERLRHAQESYLHNIPIFDEAADAITALRTKLAETEGELAEAKAHLSALETVEPRFLAWCFHEAYERLAPDFGYVTRPESRSWDETSTNAKLMIAVAADVMRGLRPKGAASQPTVQQSIVRKCPMCGAVGFTPEHSATMTDDGIPPPRY